MLDQHPEVDLQGIAADVAVINPLERP